MPPSPGSIRPSHPSREPTTSRTRYEPRPFDQNRRRAQLPRSGYVQLRFSATDGSEHTQDLAPAAAGYIVEFRDPPLVLAAKSAAKRGMASYHATFVRFRADASAILNQGRAAKTAIQPDIRREYFETFNGVSISMPRAAMEKVRELPYVKRVWPHV